VTRRTSWDIGDHDEPAASSFPIRRRTNFLTFRRGLVTQEATEVSTRDWFCAVAVVLSRHNDGKPVRLGIASGSVDQASDSIASLTFFPNPDESVGQLCARAGVLVDTFFGGSPGASVVAVGQLDVDSPTWGLEGRFVLEDDRAIFDYGSDYFNASTAENLLNQVMLVLSQLQGDPASPVRDLNIMSERERETIISRDARRPIDGVPDPWDLIHRWERKTPDRVAIIDEFGSLTYRDLIGHVQRAIRGMTDVGVGSGHVVTVPVAPDRWSVIAMLAALWLGACYVPLDEQTPRQRRRVILDQVTPSAELMQDGGRLIARACAVSPDRIVTVAGDADSANDDLAAYVLFTSGSTGVPKGVAISRRSLASLLTATDAAIDRQNGETWISLHSFAFDASVWEIYGSLCYGGTLVIASAAERRDPDRIVEIMDRHAVHSLTISPTAFEGFKRAVERRPAVLSSLRRIILCAEPLSVPSVDEWFDQWGEDHPALLNMYGITETTVHSTVERLRRSDGEQRIRIGVGLSDTPIFVVDDQGRLVPDGVAGEILVGGGGVALGYVGPNRATLDERFVPDRFSRRVGRWRLYRSGDIGRRLGDGALEYLGRRDRQLKVRGYRIEAGDLEAAARQHDAVIAARAWAQPDEDGSVRLCLAVETHDRKVTADSMVEHLESLLPEYMIPSITAVVETFPTTVNGKLDTGALLAIRRNDAERGGARKTSSHVASPRDCLVAEAMAAVLGLEDLPADTNFFRSGGDSITAIRLVGALHHVGLVVSLAEIYRHRTVTGIASVATASSLTPVGEAVATPMCLPATALQRGMIYHNLLDGPTFYHDLLYYRLSRPLDATLRSALDSVTAHHPVLRSAFVRSDDGQLVQQVIAEVQLELQFHDVRRPDDAAKHLQAWARRERERGFDVASPGLVRVAVHNIGSNSCVLSVSVHHAILDGWSAAMFVTELLTAWASGDQESRLAVQEQFALGEYGRLVEQSRCNPEHRMFWQRRIAALVPPSFDCTISTDSAGRVVRIPIELTICQALDRHAAGLGVSQKSVFLAVHFAAVVAASRGQAVPTTGLVTGGRSEVVGGTHALGLFLNTLPLRLDVDGGNWRDVIQRTFEEEVTLAPFRRFPLAELQAMAGRRLIDVAFNYTNFRSYRDLESRGLVIEEAWYDEQTEFPILATVNRSISGDGAELVVVARVGVEQGFEHRYAQAFGWFAASLSRSVDASIDMSAASNFIPWGEPAIAELAGSQLPIRCDALLGAIRDHALQNPDSVAVIGRGSRRTYSELWAELAQVSAQLGRQGARTGSRVLIEGERSIGMVTALLATWVCGACAVPIDAALPYRRREQLSEMAAPTVRAIVADDDVTVLGAVNSDYSNSAASDYLAEIDPRGEAYLLFTSGTTGVPKGVVMPFEALANLVAWQVRRFGAAGPGRVALFATVGFDVSLQETLACLVGGGTLVVVPPDVKIDPLATLALLQDQAVDVLFTPPLILRQLARAWQAGGAAPRLRWVICAGEALVIDEQLRRFGAASGFRLVNQYGPTETHVVTEADLGDDPNHWPDQPGIGIPIDNVSIRCEPVEHPRGGLGELVVIGAAVALGYLRRGQGAIELLDGFSAVSSARTYRTGDLACLGAHGIEFHGRADSQVKIRGYRVDLVEIERMIRAMDAVADCVVRVKPDARGASLQAVVQPRPGATIDEHAVRTYLSERLPVHAVPAEVDVVSRLTADNRGKTDRSAQLAPRLRRRSTAGRSPLERTLLDAWSDVLGRRQVSIDETFFTVGGSSLLLLDLFLRLRSEISTPFEIRHLLQYPTVSSFASFIRMQEKAEGVNVAANPTVR
jgi:amino acid adenylation domain-containing protein